MNSADVVGGSLSGVATIGADGKATISVTLVADAVTEGAETLTVSVAGKTASATVNDTSIAPVPTYALAGSAASVNEGGTAIFTLTTTNVAAGSKFDYTLSGVTAADVVGGLLAGTATVGTDGKAIVEVTLAADATTEGAETLTMAVAGQSASTTVNDTSLSNTTFVLTTNADNIAGSTGNDTINANWTAATGMTFQGSDSIDGGAGTDTLYIQAATAGTFTAGSLTNVETVSVNVLAAALSTINLLGSTGVTTVAVDGSLAGSVSAYSNIGSTSVALKSANTTGDVTFGYTAAAVAGTTDSATLTLSNVTGGTQTIAGIETLNIVSSSGPNTVTGLVTANTTKIVMTGDQNLSAGTLGTTVTNVDASAATGGLTTTLGAVAAATVTGGAGNDSFTLNNVTGTVNATGGAGNDTFTAAANLTITDTISGGDGTDTLSSIFASVSTAGYTTPTTRTITGIETLSVSDGLAGALTAVGIDTGITSVTMARDGVNNAAAVTFNAGNSTLNIGTSTTTAGALAGSLAVVGATTGLDNITVKNSNLSTVDAFGAGVAITATGTETLTINTGSYTTAVAQTAGAVSVTGSVGFQTAETLVITGANILTLGAVTADIINASAMTSVTG
ncbi:beta strand repeat-containing protein, partial [Rhodovarius sp.]|uniref:beta strand repeat-containing protein n=1 Tax=Rhodovarius sp. TaxID=2972673 RepID=UPI0034A2899C